MGGQSTPTTTTQIQKTELPAWVDAASQANYGFAQQVADRPFQQYQGERVAPLSQGEQDANGTLAAGMSGASNAYSAAGQGMAALAGGFNPGTVSAPQSFLSVNAPGAAQSVDPMAAAASVNNAGGYQAVSNTAFDPSKLANYQNPYLDNVVNTTMSDMQRATTNAMQQNSDANRASGAWGGSRDAISNAVLQSEGIRNQAATEAQLRSSAYTDAANRLQADNAANLQAQGMNQQSFLQANAQDLSAQEANQASTNTNNALNASILQGNQSAQTANNALNVQAQTANQGALQNLQNMGLQAQTTNAANRLAGANLGLQASSALGSLGDSITNSSGKNALLQSQFGANARSVQQAQDDAAQQMFQEQYQAPLDALNTRLAALGMSPYGKTTSSTQTTSGGTSSNTGLSILGGAMSFLPLMFGSDERLKKNVKTVGTTEIGVPLKEFEYKGFMGRKMPGKQIGVMAQDVEKVRPDAVGRFRGDDGKSYRAVDYAKVGRGFMGRKARAA